MNIIIPMAGMGKRMRPHTLTIPKPLIPIAGKPIVQRLVEDIARVCPDRIDNIVFVTGHFGEDVEQRLLETAAQVGATGHIRYQEEALGTAHAVYCGQEFLEGPTVIAFADTLFSADFKMDVQQDGIIWVKEVEDPSAFGVVTLDSEGYINGMVEKPNTFVSNLAIIGIYFVKNGLGLKTQIEYLLNNDLKTKGEYQLTDALENMRTQGARWATGAVTEWLDCGNKDATVYTNQRMLELIQRRETLVSTDAQIIDSIIIPPCYIGAGARIEQSVLGPHASIGAHSHIRRSVLKNSIVQEHTSVQNVVLSDSMIGNHARLNGKAGNYSLGDYSTHEG
ncbi:MAG: NTP transferase domain-containing protein [Bacteroidetes bacterium]|nr:NTP transferase domain-containing protein [Bacteroidota bacterium]